MRKYLAPLLLLALARPAPAQTVELPPQLTVQFGQPAKIVAKVDGGNVTWMVPDRVKLADGSVAPALTVMDGTFFGGDSKKAMVYGTISGQYRLWAITAKGDKVSDLAETMVTVVGLPPPPPPAPPGPAPGPNPPDPKPPAPAKALRVLIVYDKDKETQLPPGQVNLIYGQAFRDFLDSKTVAEAGTGWKAWRIYATATNVGTAPKEFQDLFNRPRGSAPWIVLADGATNAVLFEGALPADAASATALVGKYVSPTSPMRKAG